MRDGSASGVLERRALASAPAAALAGRYAVELVDVGANAPIPGSYWGAPEVGLISNRLYARPDTPAHSLLHELAHYVCMTPARRATLDTDAGGDADEECAVCYLQLVLAAELPGFGRERCAADMDRWGYSFREGSTRAWLGGDARDAHAWLRAHRIVGADTRPTWRLRA